MTTDIDTLIVMLEGVKDEPVAWSPSALKGVVMRAIDVLTTEHAKVAALEDEVKALREKVAKLQAQLPEGMQNQMTDNRVDLELELTDEEFLTIARMAHEKDITINRQIELLLEHAIAISKNRDHTSSEFSTDSKK